MTEIRFGRAVDELPEQLAFGSWGVLDTEAALDVFQETLDYFDQEDIRKAEDERKLMILAARRYFDGYHAKPLTVRPGEPDDNVILNFCRSLIDDSVSWLFGNPETGVLAMKTEEESEQAAKLLTEVYEKSGGFNFFKRWGIRGSVAGHFFIKIIPQDGKETPVRLVVQDPMLTTLRTDTADIDRVIAYKVEWKRQESEPGSRRKDSYIYRQLAVEVDSEAGAWVVGDFKCKERSKRKWMLVQAWAWPWRWAPFVDGPNLEPGWGYYGLSDMEDVGGVNDGVNFLSSNVMRILKHHAHPKTIGTGFDVEELVETSVDSFWAIPNPDARVQNLEMQSDLKSSMDFLQFLKVAFWTVGRGLDPAVYADKIGQVTNFALRVLAVRAIYKTGDKRQTYGKALRTINARVLEIAGAQPVQTVIQWPDSLPEDPADLLSRLNQEIVMEVTSRQTVSEELGRSWKTEQERIRQEKKERGNLGQFLMEGFDRGETEPFGKDEEGEGSEEGGEDDTEPEER